MALKLLPFILNIIDPWSVPIQPSVTGKPGFKNSEILNKPRKEDNNSQHLSVQQIWTYMYAGKKPAFYNFVKGYTTKSNCMS